MKGCRRFGLNQEVVVIFFMSKSVGKYLIIVLLSLGFNSAGTNWMSLAFLSSNSQNS